MPHTAWDPQGSQRVAAAAGLWDGRTTGTWSPQVGAADQTHPGGAIVGDPTPSAFFDSAFRFDEPFEAPYRNNDQRNAIADGDLSPFFADVDFGKLADGTDDESGVPTSGYMTRVFASQFEKEQGRRLPCDPGGPPPAPAPSRAASQTGSGEGSGDKRPSLQFG